MSFTTGVPVSSCELSVVVPAFNEGRNIESLAERLIPVLDEVAATWEIVFVDDGSRDDTLARIRALAAQDRRIRGIAFSRNFGKEIAIAAGLDHAGGRAVVIMDADLQHPPEVVRDFVAKWRDGHMVVYGVRNDRTGDGVLRRKLTESFYRLFAAAGETPLPPGAGDFRLLDRKAVDALRSMGERARFSKGLYAWIGFRSVGVPFDVADRAEGVSKFTFRRLFSFAFDGITSFSTAPLRVWTWIGAVISVGSILSAVYFLVRTATQGVDVPGYASLIVSIMFFSGIQLISLGVLGEYIGRIFAEVKRRPLYIVDESVGFTEAAPEIARPVLVRRPA